MASLWSLRMRSWCVMEAWQPISHFACSLNCNSQSVPILQLSFLRSVSPYTFSVIFSYHRFWSVSTIVGMVNYLTTVITVIICYMTGQVKFLISCVCGSAEPNLQKTTVLLMRYTPYLTGIGNCSHLRYTLAMNTHLVTSYIIIIWTVLINPLFNFAHTSWMWRCW